MHGFSIADHVATDRSTFDPEQQQEQEEYGVVDAFGVAAAAGTKVEIVALGGSVFSF